MLSAVVPTWTLLAALTAGLILGALGSRLFLRSPSPPAVMAALPPQEPMPQEAVVAEPEPAPPPAAAPAPPPEPLRISMEAVVSAQERPCYDSPTAASRLGAAVRSLARTPSAQPPAGLAGSGYRSVSRCTPRNPRRTRPGGPRGERGR